MSPTRNGERSMFIYVGKNFTAAFSGAVARDVTCEKCGCAYHYQLVRRGQGTGSAPYYINQGGAQRRAEKGAKKSLEKQLKRDIDPVPCPDCGWFQSPMVRELRKRSLRWLNWAALALGIIGAITLLIFASDATGEFNRALSAEDRIVVILMAGVLVAATAGPVLLRHFILRARVSAHAAGGRAGRVGHGAVARHAAAARVLHVPDADQRRDGI
jgi:hypothetical protein